MVGFDKVCTLTKIGTAVPSNQTEDLSDDLDHSATGPRSRKGCMTRLCDTTEDNAVVLLNSIVFK